MKQNNEENYEIFLRWIAHRIKKKKNVLIITVGGTGTGKSYSNLRAAYDVDNLFNENSMALKPLEFLNVVNSQFMKRNGASLLYDDAGITLSSKNWYSATNKMINYYLQIARADHHVLFFNTPDISFIDSTTRKLFHLMLITAGIDYERGIVRLKPLFLQTNPSTGKVYAKYLVVRKGKGYGSRRKLNIIEVPLPPKALIDAYEAKKRVFVDKLKEEIIQTFEEKTTKNLTYKQEMAFNSRKAGLSVEDIAKQMGITPKNVYEHLIKAKKKGFDLENGGTSP